MEPLSNPGMLSAATKQYEDLWKDYQGLKQKVQRLQDALRQERMHVRLLEKTIVCPVCEGKEIVPHFEVEGHYGRFHLVRCQACGLIFLGDDRSEFQDQIVKNARVENVAQGLLAKRKQASENVGLRQAYEQERNLFFSVLSRRIQEVRPAGRILDVGCGDGYFLTFFPERTWQRFGIDYNPENAGAARMRGIEVYPGSWETFTAGEPFDVITMVEFIEHIPRPLDLLRWARGLLCTNGLLVIQTENVESATARNEGADWYYFKAAPDHCVFFSPTTLCRALDRAGFRASYGGPGTEDVITVLGGPLPDRPHLVPHRSEEPASEGEAQTQDRRRSSAADRQPPEDLGDRHARQCNYLRRIIEKKDQEILRLREALRAARSGSSREGERKPAQGGT